MRKLMYLTLAVCLMMAGAVAANAAEPAAAKIGVVDMQAVATQSEPAQAAKKQMESKYGKERAALEKQGEALKKAAEELKGPKASDEKKLAFIRKKQELDQKTRNFLRKVNRTKSSCARIWSPWSSMPPTTWPSARASTSWWTSPPVASSTPTRAWT